MAESEVSCIVVKFLASVLALILARWYDCSNGTLKIRFEERVPQQSPKCVMVLIFYRGGLECFLRMCLVVAVVNKIFIWSQLVLVHNYNAVFCLFVYERLYFEITQWVTLTTPAMAKHGKQMLHKYFQGFLVFTLWCCDLWLIRKQHLLHTPIITVWGN